MNSNGFQRRGRLTCMVYSGSFFEVSAQLIPVLFLAMVVEEKLQPDSEETPSERVGRSWLFVSLVIGELLALSVIAGGLSPSKGVGGLVALSMLFAAFLMALPALREALFAAGHDSSPILPQSILPRPASSSSSFAFEKGRLPRKPR
jgi:hypothetical protein